MLSVFSLTFISSCPLGLFAELDCRPDLGVINYGVSMTTLEDVFLRLEAEAEVDQAGKKNIYSNLLCCDENMGLD